MILHLAWIVISTSDYLHSKKYSQLHLIPSYQTVLCSSSRQVQGRSPSIMIMIDLSDVCTDMANQKQQKHVAFATGHKLHDRPEIKKALVPKRREHQAPEPSDKGNKHVVKSKRKGECKKKLDKKTGVWTISARETTETTVREWDTARGKWILVPETSTRRERKRYDPKSGEYEHEWEYCVT